MSFRRSVFSLAIALALPTSLAAHAAPPQNRPVAPARMDGAALLGLLGPRHGPSVFAPSSRTPSALVAIPSHLKAEDLGLDGVAPGIGRLRGTAETLVRFGQSHPELRLEVAPPLRLLSSGPGQWVNAAAARGLKGVDGGGVLVGVADTGVDVTHPDLLDEEGHSRVAWLLDLSRPPTGKYRDLEERFGIKDASGKLIAGAVLASEDIDELVRKKSDLPQDEVGHGTHVASIATARGVGGSTGFVGIAPRARLVFARVTRSGTEAIENDDLLRGTEFMFERADFMRSPVVVNLSVGTDFGPHDGTMLWEQTLASYVGPDKPGHVLVVAAGNSGSIAEGAVHESVRVAPSGRTRVPVRTRGAESGTIQIWITTRPESDLRIGLESPSGEWIAPIPSGEQRRKDDKKSRFTAGIIHGSGVSGSPIPPNSQGAIVLWTGAWEAGEYRVTFEGHGAADLWIQAGGDALGSGVGFSGGVREGTINLPADHPSIIAVGCTVDRPKWTSIAEGPVSIVAPTLDTAGGRPLVGSPSRRVSDGEVCWFSSAGPNARGVPKPEISAPGAGVVAAMSAEAAPPSAGSIFTVSSCPAVNGKRDPRCLQVDDLHGVAVGTSMSAPHVSGAIALLLQRDPTLTQDKVLALLQAGAHRFRGPDPFPDQGGPGELDVLGSLEALDAMQNPRLALPSRARSWISASRNFVPADGSAPVTAIVELRTEDGLRPADLFEHSRLKPLAVIGGRPVNPAPELVRRGPGVWTFTVQPEAGLGGYSMELGATFDGELIVSETAVLPIATDPWTANYPPSARGGCGITPAATPGQRTAALVWFGPLLAIAAWKSRRRRRP